MRCESSASSASSLKSSSKLRSSSSPLLPMIYVISPTFSRPTQIPDLTRLSHTLLLIPRLHWILVEDASSPTPEVTDFLSHLHHYFLTGRNCHNYDLTWTRLHVQTPAEFKMRSSDPSWLKPKGVLQRNRALDWLRQEFRMNVSSTDADIHAKNSVVYFADDDNTYDVRLFDEMRFTERVSIWPVGLAGNLKIEKPLVKNGHVIGFNSIWKPERPFPIDMAAFAVNLSLLLQKESAVFTYEVPRGYQESHILSQLISSLDELEPKADSCSRVYVWHTRTEKAKLTTDRTRSKKNRQQHLLPSNREIEL